MSIPATPGVPHPRTHSFVALTYLATLLLAGLLGFGVSATQTLAPEPPGSPHLWSYLIGFTLGNTVVIGLIGAAGFYGLVLRGSGRSPLLYVAGIFGLVWLVVFAGVGLVAYPRAFVGVRTQIAGEVRTYLRSSLARRERYRQQVAAINVVGALDPAHLAAQGGIQDGRERITAARRLVAQEAQEAMDSQITAQSRIGAISPEAAASFGASSAVARRAVNEGVQLNIATLDEIGALLDFLESHRNGWQMNGQILTFVDQEALNGYSAHIARLRQLAEQEQALESRIASRGAAMQAAIDAPDPLAAYNAAMNPP